MNNCLFDGILNKFLHLQFKILLILGGAFVLFGLMGSIAYGQKAKWRYVTTIAGGTKAYLNDEIKSADGKNKLVWEKVIKADGSAIIVFEEWNCADKLRRVRQLTFYRTNQIAIGTKKDGFKWTPIIPGAVEDNIYRRVCLPAAPKIAEITRDRAGLRALPDDGAPPLRSGKRGERFEVVPESGLGNWFNLVDPETQNDYWLTGDDFKVVEPPSPDDPQAGGSKSSRTKPKSKAKKRKS